MIILAVITVRTEKAEMFRTYEHRATAIMARHGGALERTVVLEQEQPNTFQEVHLVRFPDKAAFQVYRADPDLQAIAGMREESVVDTQIMTGHDGPVYGEGRF